MTTLSLLQASRALVAALGEECFHVEAGTCGPFKMDEQCGNHGLSWPCPVDALRAAIAAAEAEEAARENVERDAGRLVELLTFRVQDRDTWADRAGELNRQANVLAASLSRLIEAKEEAR